MWGTIIGARGLAKPRSGWLCLVPIAIGILSFLCQDKKEKRIQVSKTFLLETFLFPSRGKPDIIESFWFLLTFFLDKKSNKKIKPVRKGVFLLLGVFRRRTGTRNSSSHTVLRARASCVLRLVTLLRCFFDWSCDKWLYWLSNRKKGAWRNFCSSERLADLTGLGKGL